MKKAKKGKSKRTDMVESDLQKSQEFDTVHPHFPELPTLNFFKKKSHDIHALLTISSQIKENIFKISQISNSPSSFLISKQNDPLTKKLKLFTTLKNDIENPNVSLVDSLTEFNSEWTSGKIEKKLLQSDAFDLPIKVHENENKHENENNGAYLEYYHKNKNFDGYEYEYNEPNFGFNNRQISLASTSDITRLKKRQTRIQNDTTNKSTNTKINLYKDDDTSTILKSANVDAMSLNSGIFFDKDKINLRTPRGFALLVHELTHINQLKSHGSLRPNQSDGNKSNPGSFNSYWEKEALDNENLTLRYIQTPSLKRNRSSITNNPIKENYLKSDSSTGYNFLDHNSPNAKIPMALSNSHNHFGASILKKGKYSGDNNDLSHDNTRDKITRLLETVSVELENFDGIDTQFNTHNKDLFSSSNSKIKLSNPVLGLTDHADISERRYTKNFYLPSSNFSYGNNLGNKIGPSNILYEGNKSDYPTSANFSMLDTSDSSAIPMFAESNRSIDSLPSSTESDQNQISTPIANIGNNSHSQQPTIIDLDLISEKVYQIIQSKIKIQKARVGIR